MNLTCSLISEYSSQLKWLNKPLDDAERYKKSSKIYLFKEMKTENCEVEEVRDNRQGYQNI